MEVSACARARRPPVSPPEELKAKGLHPYLLCRGRMKRRGPLRPIPQAMWPAPTSGRRWRHEAGHSSVGRPMWTEEGRGQSPPLGCRPELPSAAAPRTGTRRLSPHPRRYHAPPTSMSRRWRRRATGVTIMTEPWCAPVESPNWTTVAQSSRSETMARSWQRDASAAAALRPGGLNMWHILPAIW